MSLYICIAPYNWNYAFIVLGVYVCIERLRVLRIRAKKSIFFHLFDYIQFQIDSIHVEYSLFLPIKITFYLKNIHYGLDSIQN